MLFSSSTVTNCSYVIYSFYLIPNSNIVLQTHCIDLADKRDKSDQLKIFARSNDKSMNSPLDSDGLPYIGQVFYMPVEKYILQFFFLTNTVCRIILIFSFRKYIQVNHCTVLMIHWLAQQNPHPWRAKNLQQLIAWLLMALTQKVTCKRYLLFFLLVIYVCVRAHACLLTYVKYSKINI